MEDKKLYTLLVFSENIAGILNQVTAVFTRRQLNIESLNVSASSIPGIHKYTITAMSDEAQIIKIARQIEKKIDVLKADYYTDDEIFFQETALYKLSTPDVMRNPEVSRILRHNDAAVIEVNETYCTVAKTGTTDDITGLYFKLQEFNCVLQYSRSGRIAVTRSHEEKVTALLERREREK
jgi:acetolactate synthase-1/3 small subunit